MTYYIIYCPENDKYLRFSSLVGGGVEWSDVHRSNHNLDELNIMERLYLGKAKRIESTQWWTIPEYESMANIMNAASASGWCLYVIPIVGKKLNYGLMDRLIG